MELEEFMFVYQDLKEQLKEIPSLPLLLKSVEKTTKKLECLNLYSLVDRRQFDFQLFQQQTFEEISTLVHDVLAITQKSQQQSINMQLLHDLEQRIDGIKQQKIEAFDKLSKMEESIQQDIDLLVDQSMFYQPPQVDNQIKQVEQYEEEAAEGETMVQEDEGVKIERLRKQIDGINTRIVKINRGKGKWFDGDHKDFIKIYNRCRGEATRIVEEGAKILGMKNIEIMDHLEVYENYLQLEKEKKLATEEYKNIKFLEQETKIQEKSYLEHAKQEKQKLRQKLKIEENINKKHQIQEFKRKKAEQRHKLLEETQKERQNQKKSNRLSADKKKQIAIRNMKLIQQKHEQFKQRNSSKGLSSSKNKSKPSSILNTHQQVNFPRPKIPKVPLPLQSKKP